jgi:hypothetical protein
MDQHMVLFRLRVQAGTEGHVRDMIQIEESAMLAEAYVGNPLDKANIQLQFVKGESRPLENPTLRITPNPVSSEARISIESQYARQIKLRFYDIAGRLIHERTENVLAGLNSFVVSATELRTAQGIVLCELLTDHFTTVERIVVVQD